MRRAAGVFERYLTVWVPACIVVGIILGTDRRQQLLRVRVATAIVLFGLESGAALATVVVSFTEPGPIGVQLDVTCCREKMNLVHDE